MGSMIHKLFPRDNFIAIDISNLKNKQIVFDGSNYLCRFLNSIRKNNAPVIGSTGYPIAHLLGFSYLIANLYENGIRGIFVFDGTENEKKHPLYEKRLTFVLDWLHVPMALKKNKYVLYKRGLIESIDLLKLSGFPVIIAPSDGESEGAWLVKEYNLFALSTNDYDGLLFGAERIIVNFNFSRKPMYLIELQKILYELGITLKQLVEIAVLSGTDYNPGIQGIGPKRGYDLILKYESLEEIANKNLFSKAKIDELISIRDYFLNPPILEHKLYFSSPLYDRISVYIQEKGVSKKRANNIAYKIKNGYLKFINFGTTLEQYTI